MTEAEMLRTFNCGIGMVLAVEPAALAVVRNALTDCGERVIELGRLVSRRDRAMLFVGRLNAP